MKSTSRLSALRRHRIVAAGLLLATFAAGAQGSIRSCSDPADPNVREVPVSTVSQLYDAVGTASPQVTKVILAPGPVYYLDAAYGTASGRLELQENMLLCGQQGDPTAVVIDASNLRATSLNPNAAGAATTGPVRVGRGDSTIEWLTVRNDLRGTGLIETDLPPTAAPTRVRVANTILDGGARGIDFRAIGAAYDNRLLEGEFIGNTIQNNVRGMGQGLRVTINGATAVTMSVTLQNNTFRANQVGILAASQSASNRIVIDSGLDLFTGNGAGAWLVGGLASTNNLAFTGRGDRFLDNNGGHAQYATGGGVVGIGGANGSSGNRARLEFFETEFSNAPAADVSTFGYFETAAVAPGTNNVLALGLDPPTGPQVVETQSVPAADGNVARRLGLMTLLSQAEAWVGLKNSDDVGTRFDLLAEVFKNGEPAGSGQLNDVAGGSSGFNNAKLDAIGLALAEHEFLGTPDVLSIRLSARVSAASGHRSGTARLWFNDALAYSRFTATVDGVPKSYYLQDAALLGSSAGPGPRKYADVFVDRAVGGNPFKPFGEWKLTLAQ